MALEVIGSGLGRTGTKSLQTALNRLGFGPCHHMVEVFMHPESMVLWIEAGAGRPDWDLIFRDYRSAVDYPGAAYWRPLADHYPGAKVINTMRDPDAWFDSTQATIFNPNRPPPAPGSMFAAFFQSFTGDMRTHDRAAMIDLFLRNTEAVKATIPPERLLVYEVREGWEPLCRFLGVSVPDEPFPAENSREEFIARAPAMLAAAQGPAAR
ncbi:MAG TPA: sulfotransferase [Allosphingosinicella sp.]|jgi:hypothetical protein|nr:sulfotransferase [Allosphingosinicella sp.]